MYWSNIEKTITYCCLSCSPDGHTIGMIMLFWSIEISQKILAAVKASTENESSAKSMKQQLVKCAKGLAKAVVGENKSLICKLIYDRHM